MCYMCCVLSCFSRVWFCVILWTVDRQSPLSTGFSRQEYWNGLPFPSTKDLPDPGVKSVSLKSPALAGRFFNTSTTCEELDKITKKWVYREEERSWPEPGELRRWRKARKGEYRDASAYYFSKQDILWYC